MPALYFSTISTLYVLNSGTNLYQVPTHIQPVQHTIKKMATGDAEECC
jgi:hypothetical protein